MGRKLNLAGKTFNKLTAMKEVEKRSITGAVLWKFKCSCGNESIHEGSRVKKGAIISCGCSRKTKDNLNSLQKTMFSDYKKSAELRKIDFDIDFDEFKNITQQNCHYCGCEPEIRTRKFTDNANGVDRVNSSLGYLANNIVPCCKICNIAKNNLSYKDFISWINRLIKFNLEEQ